MIDETASSLEISPDAPEVPAAPAPRARRISNPRPKKTAKTVAASPASAVVEDSVVVEIAESVAATGDVTPARELQSIPFPSTSRRVERVAQEALPFVEERGEGDSDWPGTDADLEAGTSVGQPEVTKRKRRRRKGKGGAQAVQNLSDETLNEDKSATSVALEPHSHPEPIAVSQGPRPQQHGHAQAPQQHHQAPQQHQHQQHQQQQQAQRSKVDPEILAKMAWKIYLAEVSEEGVALIGDNDAKDLSRRCFKLAEIFIEEQMRRR